MLVELGGLSRAYWVSTVQSVDFCLTEINEPVAEKGVAAWGFLAISWEGSKTIFILPRFHESLTTHADIPF